MTRRHSIENAYYDRHHDVFVAELKKLLDDQQRLVRLRSLIRGLGPQLHASPLTDQLRSLKVFFNEVERVMTEPPL